MILEGAQVRLEPLTLDHHAALCEVGLDPELWQWIPYRATTAEEMLGYIESALKDQAAGTAQPFATVERATGRVIGSTRYMNIDVTNRRREIGATWIAKPWQRTAINTEAKYLMLRHAFETLGMHSRGTEDGRAESKVAQRDFADRRQRRRHAAPAHAYLDRTRARHGLLQHSRFRVARCKDGARSQAHAKGVIAATTSAGFSNGTKCPA